MEVLVVMKVVNSNIFSCNLTDLELCDKINMLFKVHTLRVLFPETSSLVTKVGSLSKKVSL